MHTLARDAVRQAARWRGWLFAGAAALPAICAVFVGLILFAGSGSTSPPATCVSAAGNTAALATIRHLESDNNYTAQNAHATASGAYQYVDTTWNNFGGYPRAWLAPPSVQDARAASDVDRVLATYHGDVSMIPIIWYYPAAATNAALMDIVPMPQFGNTLTPRQYQTRWMETYRTQPATAGTTDICSTLTAGNTPAPTGITSLSACTISWGGYPAGQIPTSAMRHSPNSGYLYPAASAAYDQMAAAAQLDGINLTGSGYHPADHGPGQPKCSNHEWGLAVDITTLTGPNGFTTPAYQWLTANAGRYGWANPAWARPTSLGGNGHGGWAGGTCCHYEPWHWEWVAFITSHAEAT